MSTLPLLIVATPSPFARKVRVAMLEKGVAFDVEVDNPWNPGSQAGRHNPLGKIPVLMTPEDGAIFDSKVIVEYLEAKWPAQALLPAAPLARVEARLVEALADGVCDAVVLIVLERARPTERRSDDWLARQMAKVAAGVAQAERRLGDRTWYVGDAFGIADIEQRRLLDATAIEGDRTAWVKAAAGRDVGGVGRLALEDRALGPFAGGGRLRGRRDRYEGPGVRVAR